MGEARHLPFIMQMKNKADELQRISFVTNSFSLILPRMLTKQTSCILFWTFVIQVLDQSTKHVQVALLQDKPNWKSQIQFNYYVQNIASCSTLKFWELTHKGFFLSAKPFYALTIQEKILVTFFICPLNNCLFVLKTQESLDPKDKSLSAHSLKFKIGIHPSNYH